MKKMMACCGLDCEKCEARIATQNNDDNLREKVAKKWTEMNGVEITKEMINCDGCCENGKKTFFCSTLCEIRQCVISKNYKNCGECDKIENCNKLSVITSNNKEALNNLLNGSV